jgi:hypothetical protein
MPTEVVRKIRLTSAEEGADDLLVKAVKIALEEAQRFGVREAIEPEKVHEFEVHEFEYARGIGFYWQDVEYHLAIIDSGEHIHLRGVKGRTMTQAKVELDVVVTSKISECPW